MTPPPMKYHPIQHHTTFLHASSLAVTRPLLRQSLGGLAVFVTVAFSPAVASITYFIFRHFSIILAQKIFTPDSLGDLNTTTRIKSPNNASQISTPGPFAPTIQQSCIPCLKTPNGSAVFDIDGPKVPLHKHFLWRLPYALLVVRQ